MAAGKKPFLSRLVRDLRLLYLFPDGRWKRERPGVLNYAGCFAEAAGSIDRVNGWEAGLHDGLGYRHDLVPCGLWAEQAPYQAVMQPERMLSMVHL